ncbi:MAG: hypothetical protein JEZ07_19435 [Phycisphaerae bacterium]|nr:hypothetical protein [Phycisphaerae bacterium]
MKTKNIMMILALILVGQVVVLAQEVKVTDKVIDKRAAERAILISEDKYPLIPAGTMIVDRKAKLVYEAKKNQWFLMLIWKEDSIGKVLKKDDKVADVKDPNSFNPYRWALEVLPGKWLTTMTKLVDQDTSNETIFRVWGELTVYNGRNFIYLKRIATDSIFGKLAKAPKKEAKPSGLAFSGDVKEENNEELIEKAKEKAAKNQKMAENMREILMKIPRTHVKSIVTDDNSSGSELQGMNFKDKSGLREGKTIDNSIGILKFDEVSMRYTFIFQSKGQNLAEPPVFVHPNQRLQAMQSYPKNTKFRISGRVSTFQNKVYVLIDKQLVVYDSDNLR